MSVKGANEFTEAPTRQSRQDYTAPRLSFSIPLSGLDYQVIWRYDFLISLPLEFEAENKENKQKLNGNRPNKTDAVGVPFTFFQFTVRRCARARLCLLTVKIETGLRERVSSSPLKSCGRERDTKRAKFIQGE